MSELDILQMKYWLSGDAENPTYNRNLATIAEDYITQLEAEKAELKAAIEEWKKEEILRAGLALKNREEPDRE